MHAVSVKVTFQLHDVFSLKEKRMIRRSLVDKARNRFNVSIAEVDKQDATGMLVVGIAIVAHSYTRASEQMDEVVRFLEEHVPADLVEIEEGY